MRPLATLIPALALTLAFAAPAQGIINITPPPPPGRLVVFWIVNRPEAFLFFNLSIDAAGNAVQGVGGILQMHITVVEPTRNKPGFVQFTGEFDVVNMSGKPVVWRDVEGSPSYRLDLNTGGKFPLSGDLTVGANGKALFKAKFPLTL